MYKTVRVAALQFGAGTNVSDNHKKVLESIEKASLAKPDLMVLPEFCNHASWYNDKEHCYEVSLELSDTFLKDVAAKAKEHNCYIVINVTLKRDEGKCSGSSLLFGRDGDLLGVSDKQVLMGHENDFLEKATELSPIVETDIGRLGLYACMDGVIAETPRDLALRGAQILCNSLNSFAFDEASLHIPVRAAENKVFVVAANKVASLIPEELKEPVSQGIHIPAHFLDGAGESQIIAPDGTIIAKGSLTGEDIVIADIQPHLADSKRRPDGNDIFANRRPDIYKELAQEPTEIPFSEKSTKLRVSTWQPTSIGKDAIDEICAAIPEIAKSWDIITLPELFFVDDLADISWGRCLDFSNYALTNIEKALEGTDLKICCSILMEQETGIQHQGVILSAEGLIHRQAQIHHSTRYMEQLELGQELLIKEFNFGKIAIVVGDDSIYPELFRLAAIKGADLVLVPGHMQERWEHETGLLERASENRLCLAFASRPTEAGASLLFDLDSDFTILTPWEKRSFDGNISRAIQISAPRFPGLTGRTLNLIAAHNKDLSGRTHLLNSRPWHLMGLDRTELTKMPQDTVSKRL